MAIQRGLLAFCPRRDQGFCVGRTRRADFDDFSITVDVRIVSGAVGLVLRAMGTDRYYMVQFDLDNNPTVVWFHTFTPLAERGYELDLVPTVVVPRVGAWHRMRVTARGAAFDVFLGEIDGPLQHCAQWRDPRDRFRIGAVGVWEHGGEAGEYRDLRVESIERLTA